MHFWSCLALLKFTESARAGLGSSRSSSLVCMLLGLRSLFCYMGDDREMYPEFDSNIVSTFDFQIRSKSRPF